MAAVRGRNLGSMGQAFTPYMVDGVSPPPGQPFMMRMQGVPTAPGYRDRIGKWNVILPPLLAITRLISDWFKNWKA